MRHLLLCGRRTLFFCAAILGGFLLLTHPVHAAAEPISSSTLMNGHHLVAYYPFDGNAKDSAGSYDLTLSGSETYPSAIFGEGLDTGTSGVNYGAVNSNLGFNGSSSIWMHTWYYFNNTNEQLLMDLNTDAGSGLRTGIHYYDHTLRLEWNSNDTGDAAPFTPVAGVWYMFDFALDPNSGAWTIYVDGSPYASGTMTDPGSVRPLNILAVGGASDVPSFYPPYGIYDDTAIFNEIPTAAEIWGLYTGNWSGVPESYYAQVQNITTLDLYDASSTSANVLKTVPADWVVQVASSTDVSGNPMIDGSGDTWFQVTDPTDGTTGWMMASDTATQYISSYDGTMQEALEASSTAITVGTSTGETGEYVLEAIDHYYNDSSTVNSLYSSDDDTGINAATTTPPGASSPNDLSMFATSSYPDISSSSFPEKVIWGIAADEDGGTGFDNTTVTYDYGHGIMQLTPNILAHEFEDEDYSTNDPRGYGSGVTIPPCASYMTSTYINCYANAGTYNTYDKYYIPYGNNSSSPMYEQYANTIQSIYANVKDGMKVLTDKLDNNRSCNVTTTPFTVYSSEYGTTTYSCADMETVLTTAAYNGSSPSTYLPAIANRLENIGTYFPGQTSSDITDIIDKIALAGASSSVYAQLYSPGDLSIQDSDGHTIGVVNGVVKNDFPFASYDPQTKAIRIFFPQDNNFTFKVSGTGTGVYRLKIGISDGSKLISFATGDMPTVPHQLDTYTLDRSTLLEGKNGVTLNVENKGDGTINKTMTYGATVSAVVPAPFDPHPATPVPLQTKFSFPTPIQPPKSKLIVPPAVPILQMPTSTRLNIDTSTFINASSTMDMETSTQINSSTQN
jgi:hypothetical protein